MADESPTPPEDPETKNIIDKLANFVARNGPEFESMTKKKQHNNSKFSFLFGGEHHSYYLWKVKTEKEGGSRDSHVTDTETSAAPSDMESLIQNLHQTKMKEQADIAVITDTLEREFQTVVQPVMNSCTKESMASGKGWVCSHSKSAEDSGKMAHFIMRRTLDSPGVEFSHKLHIIYLINDILYHCIRKEAHDLKQALETVVVQIFYNVYTSGTDKSDQLVKVLNIWETQKYLSEAKISIIKKLLSVSPDLLPKAPPIAPPPVAPQEGVAAPPPPWAQGQATPPVPHPPPWQQAPPPPPGTWDHPPPPPPGYLPPPPPWGPPPQPPWTHPPIHPPPPPGPPLANEPMPLFPSNEAPPPPPEFIESIDYNHQKVSETHPPDPTHIDDPNVSVKEEERPLRPHPPDPALEPHPSFRGPVQVFDYNHRPPPNVWDELPHPPPGPPPFPPQLPPPGPHPFPFPPPPDQPFMPGPHPPVPPPFEPPHLPYFELPAGLMIPLIPLHESSYRPLNPGHIVLPAPIPPTERLLKAVEDFYQQASEDKPRNEEGWEAKALLEFYDAKTKAKEMLKSRGGMSGGGGGGGGRRNQPPRRRSPSPRRRRRRSSSSSSSSPPPRSRRRSSRSPSSGSSSSSSRSPSPHQRRKRRGRGSRRSRSRSSSPFTPTLEEYPRKKSAPTPVSVATANSEETKLTEGNVGHQMLKRMGWEGAGLGSKEQGIQAPIKGGEARHKADQFAGIGMAKSDDPFEVFRRSKSYTYNRRPPSGPP